jgi:hypothetical protein
MPQRRLSDRLDGEEVWPPDLRQLSACRYDLRSTGTTGNRYRNRNRNRCEPVRKNKLRCGRFTYTVASLVVWSSVFPAEEEEEEEEEDDEEEEEEEKEEYSTRIATT